MWKLVVLLLIQYVSCLYKENSKIIKINKENYEKLIESEVTILIHAYSTFSKQSEKLSTNFMKISEKYDDGDIEFAYIEIDKEQNIAYEFGIKKPNTFYLLKNGRVTKFPENLLNIENLKKIHTITTNDDGKNEDFEIKKQKGFKGFFNEIKHLNDENFHENLLNKEKPWMVLFYSPKFKDTKFIIPIWYETSKIIGNKVNFVAVDSSENSFLSQEYELGENPTGLLIIRDNYHYLHYNHHIDSDFLIEWINCKIEDHEEESNINELTNQYFFDKCIEKTLCITLFLPHILDCQKICRNNYLKIYQDIHQKYKNKNFGWLWSEFGTQNDLENFFGIDNTKTPIAVIIDKKKSKYAIFNEKFSSKEFIKVISNLNGKFVYLKKKNFKIYDKNEWDGKEGKINHFDYFDQFMKIRDEL